MSDTEEHTQVEVVTAKKRGKNNPKSPIASKNDKKAELADTVKLANNKKEVPKKKK